MLIIVYFVFGNHWLELAQPPDLYFISTDGWFLPSKSDTYVVFVNKCSVLTTVPVFPCYNYSFFITNLNVV